MRFDSNVLRSLLIISTILLMSGMTMAQEATPSRRPVETQEQKIARIYEEALMLWLSSPDAARPRLQRVIQLTPVNSDIHQLARTLLRLGNAE